MFVTYCSPRILAPSNKYGKLSAADVRTSEEGVKGNFNMMSIESTMYVWSLTFYR